MAKFQLSFVLRPSLHFLIFLPFFFFHWCELLTRVPIY
nr:MAG TPA: hypothetical protein [Caudoviricetes sp.]